MCVSIGPVCRSLHSFAVHCLLNTLFTTDTVHRPRYPIRVSDVWRFLSFIAGFAIRSVTYLTPNTLEFERNFRQRCCAIRPCPVEYGNIQCIRQNSNNDRRVYSSLLPVTRLFNNAKTNCDGVSSADLPAAAISTSDALVLSLYVIRLYRRSSSNTSRYQWSIVLMHLLFCLRCPVRQLMTFRNSRFLLSKSICRNSRNPTCLIVSLY